MAQRHGRTDTADGLVVHHRPSAGRYSAHGAVAVDDYKTSEWHFDWSQLAPGGLADSLATVALRPLATAYLANAQRLLSLSMFAHSMFASGSRYERAGVAANMAVLGRPFPARSATGHPDTTGLEERLRLQHGYLEETIPCPEILGVGVTDEAVIASTPPFFRKQSPALMATQLVGSWTTFETLARDAWETCLNTRPKLGFAALGADPLPDDDDDERERKRRTKFSLPVWLIEKWGFDLRDRMGSLLLFTGRWDFARRNEATDAYVKVFGHESRPQLKAIFGDKSLQWLAAARNAVVHNAGVADAEFVKLVAQHPTLRLVAEKTAIPFDGLLCRELVGAGCRSCLALLRFVDGWMALHP
jgi:hypothetical protein